MTCRNKNRLVSFIKGLWIVGGKTALISASSALQTSVSPARWEEIKRIVFRVWAGQRWFFPACFLTLEYKSWMEGVRCSNDCFWCLHSLSLSVPVLLRGFSEPYSDEGAQHWFGDCCVKLDQQFLSSPYRCRVTGWKHFRVVSPACSDLCWWVSGQFVPTAVGLLFSLTDDNLLLLYVQRVLDGTHRSSQKLSVYPGCQRQLQTCQSVQFKQSQSKAEALWRVLFFLLLFFIIYRFHYRFSTFMFLLD